MSEAQQSAQIQQVSVITRKTLSDPISMARVGESIKRMVLLEEPEGLAPVEDDDPVEGPILGIDLGTTNCCCAMVKESGAKRPFVIPSKKGHNTIPSVLAFNDKGKMLVGHAAHAQMEINPAQTIYGAKRLVGRPFDSPVVAQVRDRFHYDIVAGPDGLAAVKVADRILSLGQVSTFILADIRENAEAYLGNEIQRAVITVPAFYNENQRQAVRLSGEMAGLKVERILNEPTAAALAYGHARNLEAQVLMVYDLGGGTFDATVLNMKQGAFEVISTGGDTFLGGVDFDAQLMDHLLLEFQIELGGRMPEMDRVAFLRVLGAAENVKRALTSKTKVEMKLPYIGKLDGEPLDMNILVTREILDDLVRPLVQRTLDTCDAVLANRSMKVEDIDEILLVGGQTRMPLVREMIQAYFGKEPLKGVHPDESVAIGAALLGGSMADEDQDIFELIDVLPISIGTGVPGGTFRNIITGGTTLPARRIWGLSTWQDNQTELFIPIYQGESVQADENEALGILELKGLTPAPAGKVIEVDFSLSSECLLMVTAKERGGAALKDVSIRSAIGLGRQAAVVAPTKGHAAADEKPAKSGGFFGRLKRLLGGK